MWSESKDGEPVSFVSEILNWSQGIRIVLDWTSGMAY